MVYTCNKNNTNWPFSKSHNTADLCLQQDDCYDETLQYHLYSKMTPKGQKVHIRMSEANVCLSQDKKKVISIMHVNTEQVQQASRWDEWS